MELNEEQLKNVVAGPNKENSEEIALKNNELFRNKKIEQLKNEKEQLAKLKEQIKTNYEDVTTKSK